MTEWSRAYRQAAAGHPGMPDEEPDPADYTDPVTAWECERGHRFDHPADDDPGCCAECGHPEVYDVHGVHRYDRRRP